MSSNVPSLPNGNALVLNHPSPVSPIRSRLIVGLFLDFNCRFCAKTWPTIAELLTTFPTSDKITFLLHPFSLPFHQNAFYVSQAVYVIALQRHDSTASLRSFLDLIFRADIQQQYLSPQADDKSKNNIIQLLAEQIQTAGIMDQDQFLAAMKEEDILNRAKHSWKYAINRGVSGTPTFFVNGFKVEMDSKSTVAQWKDFLLGLSKET